MNHLIVDWMDECFDGYMVSLISGWINSVINEWFDE